MKRDTFAYIQFYKSLRADQQKEFDEASINRQKDWYISYLEKHYCSIKT